MVCQQTVVAPTPGGDDIPPDLFDSGTISHEQLELISPIRQQLWERAGWSGIMYAGDEAGIVPPILGIIFDNRKVGEEIFASWLADMGQTDEKRELRLTIIRGISETRPHWYRFLIGANLNGTVSGPRIFMVMQRIHTMMAASPINLDRFLKAYRIHHKYWLVPAFMHNDRPELNGELRLGMYELNVREAWQIGRHHVDSMGVKADDDVIIPPGVHDPPVLKLQAWKREGIRLARGVARNYKR